MANLIAIYSNTASPIQPKKVEQPVIMPEIKTASNSSNLLLSRLEALASVNKPTVQKTSPVQNKSAEPVEYKNDLRKLFRRNEAKILAIIPRTFTAEDTDNNDLIDNPKDKVGTFLSGIKRLDEVKAQGFNTVHLLPIHPPGYKKAMGLAGSLYSPLNMLEIDPMLDDKNDPRSVKEEFKEFIDEAHKRGIKVMIDLPSCASLDLYEAAPDLMARERYGGPKTPQGWNDIRMFQPWEDEGKRTLNPKLLDLHKKYVDFCVDLGVDGIRADVARAKPVEFWDIIIPYSHTKDRNFAWLGEVYTYEDASPQNNMPYDRPEDTLRSGFDAYYGQYHNFHEWEGSKDLMDFVKTNLKMSHDLPVGKTLIGSFTTHDDISPMYHGEDVYCNLTAGLQATLPMLNPYYVDGYQSGDDYSYQYTDKFSPNSKTESHKMTAHEGKLDIFNLSRKPGGDRPEIGKFMTKTFEMRDKYKDIITKGSFIELEKVGDKNDKIISYARHLDGKTLLIIANKNVNLSVAGTVKVPSLKAGQDLKNLLPSYGEESILQAKDGEVGVDLAPGRVHVFEIDTPNLEFNMDAKRVHRQHL